MKKYKYKKKRPSKRKTKTDRVLSLAKSNRKWIKQLTHYAENDQVLSGTTSTTPVATHLAPTGTGNDTTITSIQVRGVLKRSNTSSISDGYRVDLVLDRTPSKVAVTMANLYDDATPTLLAFKKFDNKERFKILKSAWGYFGKGFTSALGEPPSTRKINWYVKLNTKVITEVPGTFSIGQCQKNAFYLIVWTDVGSNQPSYAFETRVVTKDDAAV